MLYASICSTQPTSLTKSGDNCLQVTFGEFSSFGYLQRAVQRQRLPQYPLRMKLAQLCASAWVQPSPFQNCLHTRGLRLRRSTLTMQATSTFEQYSLPNRTLWLVSANKGSVGAPCTLRWGRAGENGRVHKQLHQQILLTGSLLSYGQIGSTTPS